MYYRNKIGQGKRLMPTGKPSIFNLVMLMPIAPRSSIANTRQIKESIQACQQAIRI